MFLNLMYIFIVSSLYGTSLNCSGKIIYNIELQRPSITFVNKSYISYVNITSRRHGRSSPLYYVDGHVTTVVTVDSTFRIDLYFYEFLSNEYKRGFVELHMSVCDLVHKDLFLGPTMRQGKLSQPCPHPPGDYHLYNMSIPSAAVPPAFPITKGRIFGNFTHHGHDVLCGHFDMELKEKLLRSGRR